MKITNTTALFGAASCVILLSFTLSIGVNFRPMRGGTRSNDRTTNVLKKNDKSDVWNDMDFTSFNSHTKCGYRKCFLLSKSNSDFGYVLGHPFYIDTDMKGYILAKRLEQENSIIQPHVTPPEKVPLNSFMRIQVETNERLRAMVHDLPKDKRQDLGSLVVSKVRTIKEGAVEVGCSPKGRKTTHKLAKKLPIFIKSSPNPTLFYEHLESSIEKAKQVFTKNPRLFRDCQFMVDEFGDVHHIDFDRAYQGNRKFTPAWIEQCFGNLDHVLLKARTMAEAEEKERDAAFR